MAFTGYILKKNFLSSFERPIQDTCSTCEELKTKLKNQILNGNGKRVGAVELFVHTWRCQKIYKSFEDSASTSNPGTRCLLFPAT